MTLNMLKVCYKIIFYSISLITIILTSCKKDEKIIFSGKVIDVVDNNFVNSASVKLYAKVINSGNYNASYTKIAENVSDENGNFNFEIENRVYVSFKLIVDKEGYYQRIVEFNAEDNKNQYQKDIKLLKESYLKINIKNVVPSSASDILKLRILNVNPECDLCVGSGYNYFYGANIDTVVLYSVVGGENVIVNWLSLHNDETIEFNNDVYCNSGDTVVLNCFY